MAKLCRIIIFFIFFPLYSVFLNLFARLFNRCAWFATCYQRLVKSWNCWILWTFNIKVNSIAAELAHLVTTPAKIIIANHKSHLDSLILWAIMPKEVYLCFAAKKELFKIPICGTILKYSGSIVIDRQNAQAALQSLRDFFTNPTIAKTLVIYAEGTRARSSGLLPFKRGPFVIAKELAIPILPIVIHGTANAMPSGKLWPIATTVKVKVLAPITVAQLQLTDSNTIKDEVWQRMSTELSTL